MISILIFFSICAATLFRPMVGLALVSQIYLIRAVLDVDKFDICYTGECGIESSPMFGLALPLLVFAIIIARTIFLNLKQKITYKIDYLDMIFVFMVFTVLLGVTYAPNLKKAFEYFGKFVLIGVSYFFITKFYLSNIYNKKEQIGQFLITIYVTSIVLCFFALYYFAKFDGFLIRLTIPGTHPIPFSLLVGNGALISFLVLITKGNFVSYENKLFLTANNAAFLFLLLCQFATNTRGVTISMLVAFIFLVPLYLHVITIKRVLMFSPFVAAGLVYFINKIDFNVFFKRFLEISGDNSISERMMAYQDSIKITNDNILLGGGTNSFDHFSHISYPHNFFLENMASFGMLGIMINVFFIMFFIYFFYVAFYQKGNDMLKGLYILIVFLFMETMFSFTLWMHKALYLHIAIISFYKYFSDKKQK